MNEHDKDDMDMLNYLTSLTSIFEDEVFKEPQTKEKTFTVHFKGYPIKVRTDLFDEDEDKCTQISSLSEKEDYCALYESRRKEEKELAEIDVQFKEIDSKITNYFSTISNKATCAFFITMIITVISALFTFCTSFSCSHVIGIPIFSFGVCLTLYEMVRMLVLTDKYINSRDHGYANMKKSFAKYAVVFGNEEAKNIVVEKFSKVVKL